MIETYYAGSYWLARPESAEACARRAERFFHLLRRCDPAWTRWYEAADSFEEEGDNLNETSGVDGRCGSANLRLSSTCVLKPPSNEGLIGERVLTAPVMAEVLRAMALAWDPEWGVATSEAHRQLAVSGFPYAGTFVGWVMYFSRLRGTVPPLPAPVRIEPVEDKGSLVILSPERFTASSPAHVALATRVHEVLDRAGLLRPLQPWPKS